MRVIEGEQFDKVWKDAGKYVDTPIEVMTEDDLTEIWDWRDIGGFDFTTPVKDQKGCGSCYTMSFIESLESRIKIKYGK